MNSKERYSGSNEDSSDEINCSSHDQSDRREQEYDDVDGTSSRSNRSSTFLSKCIILDVKISAADFMFPTPWRPVVSLSLAPKAKFQTQKLRALYRRENVHWTMFSRFDTPQNFCMFIHWIRRAMSSQCLVQMSSRFARALTRRLTRLMTTSPLYPCGTPCSTGIHHETMKS